MFSLTFCLLIYSTFMFFFMKTPLSMGLNLILQTIFLSLFFSNMMKSFWFLYMLILVYIGGMLVLFIYMTSIIPNSTFNFKQSMLILNLIMMSALILLFLFTDFFNYNMMLNEFKINFQYNSPNFISMLIKLMSFKTNIMMIFLVIYLFYCMLVVIKITAFTNGPLRKLS